MGKGGYSKGWPESRHARLPGFRPLPFLHVENPRRSNSTSNWRNAMRTTRARDLQFDNDKSDSVPSRNDPVCRPIRGRYRGPEKGPVRANRAKLVPAPHSDPVGSAARDFAGGTR